MNEDYSGTLSSHKMVDELIPRSSVVNGTFVLSKGAFFSDSLTLIEVNTNTPLTVKRDFKPRVLDSAATGHAGGKEVHTLIELNAEPASDLKATYQYVGGRHIEQRETLINLISELENINLSNIFFSQLKGRPHAWNVTEEHLHDASQVTGKEEEIAALAAIKDSIVALNDNIVFGPESHLFIYITEKLTEFTATLLTQTKRIDDNVEADLGQDAAIIRTQAIVTDTLRRLMNVEVETDFNTRDIVNIKVNQEAQDNHLAEQTLSIIKNQTQTIGLSQVQMELSERVRLLENN